MRVLSGNNSLGGGVLTRWRNLAHVSPLDSDTVRYIFGSAPLRLRLTLCVLWCLVGISFQLFALVLHKVYVVNDVCDICDALRCLLRAIS